MATKHVNSSKLKSIIAPHAGYAYSGPIAAKSFINIIPENYDRVIVIGPSHFEYFKGCGLTKFLEFQTPFGNIQIDHDINKALIQKNKLFHYLSNKSDEKEHCIEMELPYIKFIFGKAPFTLASMVVGEIDNEDIKEISNCLKELYANSRTLFVISSDFCHWGKDFDFTYYDKSFGKIWESIKELDQQALDIIKEINTKKLDEYFNKTENTICGKYPIMILLTLAESLKSQKNNVMFECIDYTQSNKVTSKDEESVSYAAVINYIL